MVILARSYHCRGEAGFSLETAEMGVGLGQPRNFRRRFTLLRIQRLLGRITFSALYVGWEELVLTAGLFVFCFFFN